MTQINRQDETPQDTNAEEAAADTGALSLVALQDKVAELEKKAAEANDKMLRALAEAENVRRRGEKERQDTAKFAVSSFARDLLPVADNMRRALSAISPEARDKSPELKNIYTGVEMTERELLRVMESNGIRRVDPMGKVFDPNLHEVIFEAEAPGVEPGTVMQVVEPGYTIHERLLRPARVGVAKGAVTESVDKEV